MDDTKTELAEFRGHILALTVFMSYLLETLMESKHLTYDQVTTICHHSDMRISFLCQELQGDTPDIALKRVEQIATALILKLLDDVKPRR
jgi:hypothetical protein